MGRFVGVREDRCGASPVCPHVEYRRLRVVALKDDAGFLVKLPRRMLDGEEEDSLEPSYRVTEKVAALALRMMERRERESRQSS